MIRNTVSKSYEKRKAGEIEALAVDMLLKAGVSLRYESSVIHPSDVTVKCDLIKRGLGELLLLVPTGMTRVMLQDMLLNTIKLKYIIDNTNTI